MEGFRAVKKKRGEYHVNCLEKKGGNARETIGEALLFPFGQIVRRQSCEDPSKQSSSIVIQSASHRQPWKALFKFRQASPKEKGSCQINQENNETRRDGGKG
jgi:hypothetical protein